MIGNITFALTREIFIIFSTQNQSSISVIHVSFPTQNRNSTVVNLTMLSFFMFAEKQSNTYAEFCKHSRQFNGEALPGRLIEHIFICLFINSALPPGYGHQNGVSQLLWARIT